MALEFHATTNEPFLRVRRDIIITPHRASDGAFALRTLNHPAVYAHLTGPPYPYTARDWDAWYAAASRAEARALREYREAAETGGGAGTTRGKWVSGQPVTVIRAVRDATGTAEAIGLIAIRRTDYAVVRDEAERARLREINDGLAAGDPRIHWEMGFLLAPAAHGRGIMSAALHALLHSFYVPYMNCHLITGNYLAHNLASRRVFEKNAFAFVQDFPDCVEVQESKCGVKGKRLGMGMMKWERKHQTTRDPEEDRSG